ncbi:hypothetical protein [Leptolyngbya sp. FACHB-261]|uniref:hypothetical protein n=1 Tax=Leptolyngbya sp. FACHB-261 TaxID=2692806 RepID=UPI00168629C1|nr:hypothetical protein [Leptolyngbya sp. FACHB-261]MBD2101535.1 hypothetical protein [Leptolyngbya sp. FACHB-261]
MTEPLNPTLNHNLPSNSQNQRQNQQPIRVDYLGCLGWSSLSFLSLMAICILASHLSVLTSIYQTIYGCLP